VGVSYEPSYRLWPLLVGRNRSELRLDVGDLVGVTEYQVELWEIEEVEGAVDRLVTPVLEHGVSWAKPFASVDALIEVLSGRGEDTAELEDIPVVLAAAGRVEEARQAIARALAAHRSVAQEAYSQEFVRKFVDWLDSGAVVPDSPVLPPPHEPHVAGEFNLGNIWKQARELAENKRAALDAVRRNQSDRSRDELRQMLAAEFDARGITVSPRDLETQLDAIEATTASAKHNLRVDAAKRLFGIARGVAGAIRDRGDGESALPEWLRPPPDAAYSFSTGFQQWCGVDLDAEQEARLERVVAATRPGIDGSHELEVWLSNEGDRVDVYVGLDRIGTLGSVDGHLYRQDISAATTLGLKAVAPARLTSRDSAPYYVLEVAAPAQQ
jgi:hypothetical protein